jgi:hypothetical protein
LLAFSMSTLYSSPSAIDSARVQVRVRWLETWDDERRWKVNLRELK